MLDIARTDAARAPDVAIASYDPLASPGCEPGCGSAGGGGLDRGRRERAVPDGTAGTIVFARSLAGVDDTIGRTAIVVVVGTLTVAAATSGYWLSGRTLRPVREMAATARGLSEQTLGRRITLDLPDDGLCELATTERSVARASATP